ncbi:hemerythrin domain-containing protein [Natronospora cellulosivora (SeqCode)]
MESIELLVNEHKYIKRVLAVARKLSLNILERDEVDVDAFYMIIDFVRNYADKHHHSKEEDILFRKMTEELGAEVEAGPIAKMLNEHQMGRMFMQKLENALLDYKNGDQESRLDIIANTIAYADMLFHHIDKEDEAVYVYGEESLSDKNLEQVRDLVNKVEAEASEKGIQDKYVTMVKELESRLKVKSSL